MTYWRIDTRTAVRRAIVLPTLADLLREIDAVESAARAIMAGDAHAGVRVTGNWSVGQILQHQARFISCLYHGPEADGSLAVRTVRRATRKLTLTRPMTPGTSLPDEIADAISPDIVVYTDAGAAELRAQVQRLAHREINPHPHPIYGSLAHEDWIRYHLRHAELHMSFIHFGQACGTPWRTGG